VVTDDRRSVRRRAGAGAPNSTEIHPSK
ncbi:CDP-alcohol phosphatidyltransferase family protein, partial [Burkholderia pseudomallei]